MATLEPSPAAFEQKRLVLRRYRKLGLEWGAFTGATIGVIAGGLRMGAWENPLLGWAIAALVLTAVGGLVG